MLFRVVARCIILRDSNILVQLSKHGDFYRLPGGRIRSEETILQGLHRELREELGIERIEEPTLLYIVDSFYRRRNGIVHELGFYFFCNNIDVNNIKPKEEHLRMKWVNIDSITSDVFRPSVLAAYLRELVRKSSSGKLFAPNCNWPVYLVNVDIGEE